MKPGGPAGGISVLSKPRRLGLQGAPSVKRAHTIVETNSLCRRAVRREPRTGVLLPDTSDFAVPHPNLSQVGVDRMRQKNAGTGYRNSCKNKLKHNSALKHQHANCHLNRVHFSNVCSLRKMASFEQE